MISPLLSCPDLIGASMFEANILWTLDRASLVRGDILFGFFPVHAYDQVSLAIK